MLECAGSKDRALLEAVRTSMVLHITASRQPISNYLNEPEKLAAKRALLDVAFPKYCAYSDSMVFRLQTTFGNETKRA